MTAVTIGRSVHDLPTPFAVLDDAALEHNLAAMAAWCRERGVELQPHGKTTMAPSLFRRQLAAGATGITAATPAQVRVMRAHGVPAVQLANELVQPGEAAWVAGELAHDDGFGFCCWVDSVDGVEVLQPAAAAAGVVVDVLLEVGVAGGRTGTRTRTARDAVRSAVDLSPNVRLIGVAGYEGPVADDRSPSSLAAVRAYLETVRAVAAELDIQEQSTPVLSAGGSMFVDVVADVLAGAGRVVLRSGCYLTHDSGLYERNAPLAGLRAALTVWGTVVSQPEPGRAFLDVGRRDVSFDQGLPVPLAVLRRGSASVEPLSGVEVTALNDQHAFLSVPPPGRELTVGDRVQLGISHPCTTFDKWRKIPLVAPDGTVTDVVETWF